MGEQVLISHVTKFMKYKEPLLSKKKSLFATTGNASVPGVPRTIISSTNTMASLPLSNTKMLSRNKVTKIDCSKHDSPRSGAGTGEPFPVTFLGSNIAPNMKLKRTIIIQQILFWSERRAINMIVTKWHKKDIHSL